MESDLQETSALLRNTESTIPCLAKDAKNANFQTFVPVSASGLYFMALHFLLGFYEVVLTAPLLLLFEQSICISYYALYDPHTIGPGNSVPEVFCKLPQIQHDLATLRAWKSFFDTLPVFLVAIPFGYLADRYGRRRVMTLSLVSLLVATGEVFVICAFPKTFPIQLIWLSAAIQLFGGGIYTATALMWAMAAQSCPKEERSRTFYYIYSAFYMAELVASALASATMDISPWIPCGMAVTAIFLCLALLWIRPIRNDKLEHAAPHSYPLTHEGLSSLSSIISRSFKDILSNRNFIHIIPVFFVGTTRYTVLNVLMQYTALRFGWKLSRAALFYTETASINIILFLFLIPWTLNIIRKKYGPEPESIDLTIVRLSLLFLLIGSLGIGISCRGRLLPIGVAIFAAGFGSRVSSMSLISYWATDGSRGRMYATIAFLDNVGHAIGDPMLQKSLAAVLNLSPFWLATPFFIAAGLYSLAFLSAWSIKLDPRDHPNHRIGQESD